MYASSCFITSEMLRKITNTIYDDKLLRFYFREHISLFKSYEIRRKLLEAYFFCISIDDDFYSPRLRQNNFLKALILNLTLIL